MQLKSIFWYNKHTSNIATLGVKTVYNRMLLQLVDYKKLLVLTFCPVLYDFIIIIKGKTAKLFNEELLK